jgi:hypothetical protein
MCRLRVTCSGISLLLILSATLDTRAESGCIQGRVLDTSGEPVPSIFVTASSLDGKFSVQVGTDFDGSFRIDTAVLAGEGYDLLARESSSFEQIVDSSEIPEGAAIRAIAGEEDRCPFVTLRQRAPARLEVKAVNLLTGAPIPVVDAHFRFSGEKSWRGATDEKGELLLSPDTHLEVQVGAAGYEDSQVSDILTPEAGNKDDLSIALRPEETGCITGTLVDQKGLPVPKARIQAADSMRQSFLSGGVTYSGADGRFEFEDMRPGKYLIFTYPAEYPMPLTQMEDVGHVTVASGIDCADASMRLGPRAAKLRVHVMDATTHELIKEAQVHMTGSLANGGWSQNVGADREEPADGDRAALIPVPALTTITVDASSKGYANSQTLTISPMQPQQVQDITILLQPNP